MIEQITFIILCVAVYLMIWYCLEQTPDAPPYKPQAMTETQRRKAQSQQQLEQNQYIKDNVNVRKQTMKEKKVVKLYRL